MGRYDSNFYNSEKYYDPTAGAALASIIRQERNKRPDFKINRKSTDFAKAFAQFYKGFGLRANGKPKKFAQYEKVYGHIRIYNWCMAHANDENFTIANAVKRLGLGSDRMIRQVFTGRGDMGKLIECYNEWLKSGLIKWSTKMEDKA